MSFHSIGNEVQKTFSSEDFKAWVAQCTEHFSLTIICSKEERYEGQQAISELGNLFKHYHSNEDPELMDVAHFSINEERKIYVTTVRYTEKGQQKQHVWVNNMVCQEGEWMFDSSNVYVEVDPSLLKKFRFNTSILYQQKFD